MSIDRSTPPPITDFQEIRLDVPHPTTLSNGVPVWVIGNSEDEINKITIYMTGGTFQESRSMQATACSMSVFNGNKNMTYAQIAEAIDYYGAWRALQTYDNCTAFALSSLNYNFEKTLPIFIDCMRFPTFPDDEFDLIKRQLTVGCATARERVMYIANKEIMRQYYGASHPLATDPTPDDINSLSQADIHNFYSDNYKAQNCNIVLAGKITDREMRIVDDVFSQWMPSGSPTPIIEPQAQPTDNMLKIVHKEGAVQAAVVMMLKAIPRKHPAYLKLRVLITVLGGYFGSRLMSNIREDKGYTYGIHSSLSGRAFDGYIGITTECDTQHTWNVIEETKKEMQRLCSELIPQQELDNVKRHMLSDLVKTLDTPFNIASYIGNMFCYGVYPEYFNEQVREIIDVTNEDLLDIARRYLDISRLRVVIACDKSKLPDAVL